MPAIAGEIFWRVNFNDHDWFSTATVFCLLTTIVRVGQIKWVNTVGWRFTVYRKLEHFSAVNSQLLTIVALKLQVF